MRPDGLAQGLVLLLDAANKDEEFAAMEALGLVRETSIVPTLVERFRRYRERGDRRMATAALEALARIGDPRAAAIAGGLAGDPWGDRDDATGLAWAFARERFLQDGSVARLRKRPSATRPSAPGPVTTCRNSGCSPETAVILPADFYARPTLEVARDLVGMVLVHRAAGGVTAGRIVEVEAYIGEADPACHAAPGPTPRNRPLYGPPGRAYVYLNYGIHHLVNAVTEPEGFPAAVLIRALAPLEGVSLMQRRRARLRGAAAGQGGGALPEAALCRGPGNLTVAMGIGPTHNRRPLFRGALTIEDHGVAVSRLAWGPRVGITRGAAYPWRCWVEGHPAVSGPRAAASAPSV